ncbi:MFS transporter [Halopseudomonas pelagia]|nr:MFS transporter [Halopseudomonas pelagia]
MNKIVAPLTITLSIQALASMAALTVPIIAPLAAGDIGGNAAHVGYFVALIYVGAMFSSVISGDLVSRFGAIRSSQVSLLLCAAGLACCSYGTLWAMFASALLIGFGYGPITPASSHILATTTPSHLMGLMFSIKQTGVPVGGALAGAFVPMLAVSLHWQGSVLAVSIACLVTAAIAQCYRTQLETPLEPTRGSLANLAKPFRLIFEHKPLRDLALCSFFFGAIQLCLTTYLVLHLTQVYGMGLVAAGLILTATQAAGIVGRILWGWIADRWISPRVLLSALALCMAISSLVTASFTPDWPLITVIVISICFGATAIGWNGVYLAEVARLAPPGKAGVVTGGTLFFTYFGVVTGPPVFALVTQATGSIGTGFTLFGFILLLTGLSLALPRRQPKPS